MREVLYGQYKDALGRGDVLVAVSQLPYSAPTVLALEASQQRGLKIIALTDSAMPPLWRRANHKLLFGTESLSFFHSLIAPRALV